MPTDPHNENDLYGVSQYDVVSHIPLIVGNHDGHVFRLRKNVVQIAEN